MSEIGVELSRVSRYAPVEISTYRYNGVEGMTFGQLMISVCCRRAAAIEDQSVIKMNAVNASTSWLKALSSVTEQLFSTDASLKSVYAKLDDTGYVCKKAGAIPTLYDFFHLECGISTSDLYTGGGTYDKKMKVFSKLKQPIESATSQSQQETIQLQSLVSRRDVTYNVSASIVYAMTQASMNMASSL